MINIIKYIFLGIVQGITEPIPVSSSGHLLIIKTILEKVSVDFSVDFETLATITNFGSLLAILLIFWKDIIKLIKAFFTYVLNKDRSKENMIDYRYCWMIVIATIPAGILGLIVTKIGLLDKLEENAKFIGLMLVVTALFLFIVKDFKGYKEAKRMSFKSALVIGIYQMIALVPGISRSGSTIVGSMFEGLKREDAFNFSFILYIPISIATSILGIKDLLEMSISGNMWIYYLLATFMAFIFTYIGTKWFSKIVKKGKLIYFSIYCLILGLLVIMFL